MAQSDLLKTALDAGMTFTKMTRERAEAIVKDLVRNGEVSREQAATQVEDLIARSRKNTDQLVALIRKEVDARLSNLATRDDLAKLASRLGTTVPGARKAPAKKAAAAKKAPAKKAAAAKKAPAKKAAAAKKAPAKKAPAKKAPTTNTPGNQAAG